MALAQVKAMNRSIFVSHASVSLSGRRRDMEDTIVVIPELGTRGFSFFAVYDGHCGDRAAKACRDKLHNILVEELKVIQTDNKAINWEQVMVACFRKMNEEVIACVMEDEEEDEAAGSTATVAVVGDEVVVVANCGTSRVVLSRSGETVALSRDHKPDEIEGVEFSGGSVNDSSLCDVLTTSRSIGDKYLKAFITCDPEVTVTKRVESDQFLIIASDGLWNVVSNDMACDIVEKYFHGMILSRDPEEKARDAVAKLAELAIARGSKDNISVIIVELNKV